MRRAYRTSFAWAAIVLLPVLILTVCVADPALAQHAAHATVSAVAHPQSLLAIPLLGAIQTFDTRDAVPEAQRESAIELKDGKFLIHTEDDPTPLKSALEKERQRANAAEEERKKADRVRQELEQKLKAGEAGLTEEKLKELRDQIRKDLEGEYGPYKTEAEKAKGALRTLQLDNAVKSTMLQEAVGVRGERVEALWRLLSDRFDLTDDGKPMVKDHPGLSVDKYLADTVKKEYPEFFKATQAAGGGAGGSSAGGNAGDAPKKPPTKWTSDERRTFIEKNGAQAYRDLLDAEIREAAKPKAKE